MSFINTFFFIFVLILQTFTVSEAGHYKSFSAYIRYRVSSTTLSSTTSPPFTTSMTKEKTENVDLTLLEKVLTGLISSLLTTFGSFACVCAFKCYRNNGQCKQSWFKLKLHHYHEHQQINPVEQNHSISLVEFNPQPSIDIV